MFTKIIRPMPVTVRLQHFLTHFADPRGGAELYLVRVIVERSQPGLRTPVSSHEAVAMMLSTEEICGPDTWRETDVTILGETHRVITNDTRSTTYFKSSEPNPNTLDVFLRGWAQLSYAAALQRYTHQLLHQTVLV